MAEKSIITRVFTRVQQMPQPPWHQPAVPAANPWGSEPFDTAQDAAPQRAVVSLSGTGGLTKNFPNQPLAFRHGHCPALAARESSHCAESTQRCHHAAQA